jgi:hypothetical protein
MAGWLAVPGRSDRSKKKLLLSEPNRFLLP